MPVPPRLSRRDFLKFSGSAALGFVFSNLGLPAVQAAGFEEDGGTSGPQLGRVVYNRLDAYSVPTAGGRRLETFKFDNLLEIVAQTRGGNDGDYNPIWYELKQGGYVYSGAVQPVEDKLNTPLTDIPKGGLLAELTVPFSDARWRPTEASRRGYRLYYGTTYWVTDVIPDQAQQLWYRIYDDLFHLTFYIRAEHLRIVAAEELTPLSPDVPDDYKRIYVSLADQLMVAYEDARRVLLTKISSGVGRGPRSWASTPTGGFFTFFKRPAGHMAGGDGISSYYDLPGVPWTSYIDNNGISFHGTYWHNDYGKPHSHGCVNLTPQVAKWLYRWTTPIVPSGKRFIYKPGTGTQVTITDQPLGELAALHARHNSR